MNQNSSSHKPYLHYIDGVRGLAISLVILFHYLGLKGGFIGVDVFFVISGFLITGIIVHGIEAGKFSFFAFYAKRVRRIFPSLFLLLIVCLGFAWYEMFDDDFRLFGKHIKAGALFYSNITLWLEAGYFDAAAETKPLLHLWSLAIEEQFYFIWPALLLFAYKLTGKIRPAIYLLIVLSFAANIFELHHNPERDFYFLHARLWELAVGGLLATLTFSKEKKFWIYETIGILLIVFGSFDISGNKHFPGWKALVPVAGTFLILMTGGKGIVNRVVFENKLMMFLGRISFPLYLWHWSVISFLNYFSVEELTGMQIAVVTSIALVLSVITHYGLELPLKNFRITAQNSKPVVLAGSVMVVVLGLVGYMIEQGKIPGRLHGTQQIPQLPNDSSAGCTAHGGVGKKFKSKVYAPCEVIAFPGRPKIFLLGDSHAGSLSNGLIEWAKANRLNITRYTAIGCTPLSLNDKNPACSEINGYILAKIREVRPELVILNSNYLLRSERENFNESIPYPEFVVKRSQELVGEGAGHVMIVGQIPMWNDSLIKVLNLKFVRKERAIPERTFEGVNLKSLTFDERLKDISSKQVSFFSMKEILCSDVGCMIKVGPELPEDLVVYDSGHLTISGSRFMAKNIGEKILPLLKIAP